MQLKLVLQYPIFMAHMGGGVISVIWYPDIVWTCGSYRLFLQWMTWVRDYILLRF